MKRKRVDWSRVPWTPFEECAIPDAPVNRIDPPAAVFRNSRYQVTIYYRGADDAQPFGAVAHLSIKVHDRSAHHDWRDLQRIKNELCGPECEAVEIFPAESRLVDTANQYHLFVFKTYRLPFGFSERLVGDGEWENSKQRPWSPGDRPADALTAAEYGAKVDAMLARLKAEEENNNNGDDHSG